MSGLDDFYLDRCEDCGGKLVPPELRTLLGLLAELAEEPPFPADDGWERRGEVKRKRRALLDSRIHLLTDELAAYELYPRQGEESLRGFWQRSATVIRAELAKPLGYQAEADAAAEQRHAST